MNWQEFKTYLENNIIENDDGESWTLTESAIDKYLGKDATAGQKDNLETIIIRLVLSLRATINELPNFHHLPDYQPQLTWERLIPHNIALGEIKRKETESLDEDNYNLLGDIFKDWQEYQSHYEYDNASENNEPEKPEEAEEAEEMVHKELNWWKFRDWLADNILNYELEVSEETITKYQVSNPTKLTASLTNLIENTRYDGNNDYHSLPYFCSSTTNWKGEADPQVKTWEQLFPTREKAYFGEKTKRELIDTQTFNILAQMHSDFVRPHKLTDQLHEDSYLTKFLMEAIVHLNLNLIKQKGYDKLLTNWLSEYTKLSAEEQKALQKPKAMVEHFLNMITEESKSQKTSEQSNWLTNLPWGKITWIGGGILIILLAWGWIKSKTK